MFLNLFLNKCQKEKEVHQFKNQVRQKQIQGQKQIQVQNQGQKQIQLQNQGQRQRQNQN